MRVDTWYNIKKLKIKKIIMIREVPEPPLYQFGVAGHPWPKKKKIEEGI
jgi:hypothetical protein